MHPRARALMIGALTPFVIKPVAAHCPLCTAGIGAVAGGAFLFGVKAAPIGLFAGALGLSMSLLFARMLPERLRGWTWPIALGGFALTVIPLMAIVPESYALYLPYGTHGTTLAVNKFLLGSLVGAGMFLAAPPLSAWIRRARKTTIPYQGVSITLALLITAGIVLQVVA